MSNITFRTLLERAALDAAFRANLLANPHLMAGLTRAQVRALVDEMSVLDGPLTDEMLDSVAGGMSHSGILGRLGSDALPGCPA